MCVGSLIVRKKHNMLWFLGLGGVFDLRGTRFQALQNGRCIGAQGGAATCGGQPVLHGFGIGRGGKLQHRGAAGIKVGLPGLQTGEGGFGLVQRGDRGSAVQALAVIGCDGKALAALQIAQPGFGIGQHAAQMGDFGIIGGKRAGGGGGFGLELGNRACGFAGQSRRGPAPARPKRGFPDRPVGR